MKVVYNKTMEVYTRLDNWTQIYLGEGQHGLKNTFAIVYQLENKGTAPLAFFEDFEECRKWLTHIKNFLAGDEWNTKTINDTVIFEIENNVPESVLITPDLIKDKVKRVK